MQLAHTTSLFDRGDAHLTARDHASDDSFCACPQIYAVSAHTSTAEINVPVFFHGGWRVEAGQGGMCVLVNERERREGTTTGVGASGGLTERDPRVYACILFMLVDSS